MSNANDQGRAALKVGDRIRDNDPRIPLRVLTISRADETYVYANSKAGTQVRIRKNRIFTDGKHRRSGFNLVTA